VQGRGFTPYYRQPTNSRPDPRQGPDSSHVLGTIIAEYYDHMVKNKDWKGELQTIIVRKYKGAVEIQYSFTQNPTTGKYEALCVLHHTDTANVGTCIVAGAPAVTKKAWWVDPPLVVLKSCFHSFTLHSSLYCFCCVLALLLDPTLH
jgi:hypothetical protein